LSPAREIFYLRGVLDYVRAASGVVAFSRKPVAPHLRDLGRRLEILVLSGGEVDAWCKSLINGVPDFGYFSEDSHEEYLRIWVHSNMQSLADYLRTDYWFHLDFRNLQNVIGHMRKVASRISGQQSWHSVVALDAALQFCLAVFDLCREIILLGVSSIAETVPAHLFGGAPSFRARRDLYNKVQQLLSSTGVLSPDGPSLSPLEPAYTSALAELAIRFIDRPQSAILVPQVLQDAFWRQLGAVGAPPREENNFLAAEKLAQDLLDFMKLAIGAPWMPKI